MRKIRCSKNQVGLFFMTVFSASVIASPFEAEYLDALRSFDTMCSTKASAISEIWALIGDSEDTFKNCDRRDAQSSYSATIDTRYYELEISDDSFRAGPLNLFGSPKLDTVASDELIPAQSGTFTNLSNSPQDETVRALPGYKNINGARPVE